MVTVWVDIERYGLRDGTDSAQLQRDVTAATRDGGGFVQLTQTGHDVAVLITPAMHVSIHDIPIHHIDADTGPWSDLAFLDFDDYPA
ncbi:hypothetical protein [Herbiconiux daphne]|uniref:DUF3303 domain-containing protein n=1 Tax=Herbiconiux daphne TaxID=2970914 RepID=A0ABT2GYQ6_9MICO|nr:hypothetical protein [Herbiconiux daphne]MCS5732447.1 hypothetical protein [Herbiconiux daphne]